MISTSPTATLYCRPTGFIDAPFGFDGQFARLAGGMQFFSSWHIIARDGGQRVGSWLVPIDQLDAALSGLSQAQAERARAHMVAAISPRAALQLGERTIRLDQPQVMGILNVTPDSFSDGGQFDGSADAAADAGVSMSAAGAALIDVGGESTRPGSAPVWEGDEIQRVQPVIERLARAGVAVSVDTRKGAVMQAGLEAGATIINDVSGLTFDSQAIALLAAKTCPIIIMHWPGGEGHDSAGYADPLLDVYDWLEARVAALEAAGISKTRLILDPGIGFGKGVSDNLALLNGLALFHTLGCPILLGASRKRFIGALSNEAPSDQRLPGSLTSALKAVEQGAQIIRVHDVAETVQAIKVWRGLRDAALTPA
jgi:dihydropteroate synthase